MYLALLVLASFWLWEFVYHYIPGIPDGVSHLLVPVLVFGMSLLPAMVLLPMAIASVLGWLHRTTQLIFAPPTLLPKDRKRAKLPPLP